MKGTGLIYTKLVFSFGCYNELISNRLSADGIVLSSFFLLIVCSSDTVFQMAAAHLKVFQVFLLFIMLTSGNLERTWLRYRNYISFVGEDFSAGSGQKSSGCITIIIPIKSCVSLPHTAAPQHFFLQIPVVCMFLCGCGDIRKTSKKPPEVYGFFFFSLCL